jgi:dinuclear metal center YbgI/SA1388 family protein
MVPPAAAPRSAWKPGIGILGISGYTELMESQYTTGTLDAYFRNILDIEGFKGVDSSLNGLQVDNDGSEIKKIAFAVDANLETFKYAASCGAGMLFVHHGLFWKPGDEPGYESMRVKGNYRARLKFLLEHNIALYAVHLPLDQHPQLGNNAGLAELLGLTGLEPFGLYHGRKIGYKGVLDPPLPIEEAVKRIAFMGRPPQGVLPFGKELNTTCAIISGSAPREAMQAIEEGIDLYVTGEVNHQSYQDAQESGLNIIGGGHYSTEVWGVRRVMGRCATELSVEGEFIDAPTGL